MASRRDGTMPGTGRHRLVTLTALAMLLAVAPLGRWVQPVDALPVTESDNTPGRRCLDGVQGTLRAAPERILLWKESSTLSWNVTVPTGCSSIRIYLGSQVVPRAGMRTVQPMANSIYRLRALYVGYGEREIVSASVAVDLPLDPASPGRRLVSIEASSWVPLLFQALGTENTTVLVANHVDMNLGYLRSIRIAGGVVLRGGRTSRDPGPRLYTTIRPPVLFEIAGDNVRISGVRIEGPDHPGVVQDEADNDGIGIQATNVVNIEIDHNEIYGWSQAAVRVNDCDGAAYCPPDGRMPPSENPTAVRIHDNYIHHNQHRGRNGYGVSVNAGAYVLIERNVFDWNRHAIKGEGDRGTGYAAYRNLVLPNGGYHDTYNTCDIPNWIALSSPAAAAAKALCYLGDVGTLLGAAASYVHYTHQFDMHGTETCGLGHLNCGDAGHSMYIRHNTFLYTAGNAIKLRGIPEVGMFVGANVFAHDTFFDPGTFQDGAVAQTEGIGVYPEPDNVLDNEVNAQAGACDFDGDGTNDTFMTTGATWWFSSADQMPWTYLNTSTVRLADISLGYFDGDNRCDVKVGDTIYPGGEARQQLLGRVLSSAIFTAR